jgi:hypothetical protein
MSKQHPADEPWMFLELKNAAYDQASMQKILELVQRLDIVDRVALWAVDKAHYDIVKSVGGGALQAVWGYMDQDFSDSISTIPYPAPFPPDDPVRLLFNVIIVSNV